MNILFVSHECDLNGASLSMLGIIDDLRKDNNIFVLTAYKKGAFVEELNKRKINYITLPYYRWMTSHNCSDIKWYIKKIIFNIAGIVNYISAVRISGFIKKNKIDLIHTNSSVNNIGAIIAHRYKLYHVWHIREFGKEDFNMEFVKNEEKCLRFINDNSTKIVFISKAIEKKYSKMFDKKKCVLIYNGIGEEYIYEKKPKETNFYNFLIAGRLENAKGQEEAIMAVNELVKNKITNIKLYIAGSGELSQKLKELVNKLGINQYIEFCGKVSNLKEMRKKMDVELVCSKMEAFGRVTIEAMMTSNPVIGANTGGTVELVMDGFNGYLYNQGDYKDLSKKMTKIISDNKKFNEMSKNAYIYSKNFTSKKNSENISNLYKEIIEE